MKSMYKRIVALSLGDMRSTLRDATLLPLFCAPLLLVLFLRFGIPFAAGLLTDGLSFDLSPYFDIIGYFATALTPLLFGMMFGFLILEERDEGVITTISITPLSKRGYVAYKLALPSVLSFVAFIAVGLTSGLGTPPWPRFLASAVLAALAAPLFALALGTYAENRVEGLAMAKALGIFLLAPFIVYFAPEPWLYAAAILPTAWPAYISFARASTLELVVVGILGVLIHGLLLFLLVRRFRRRVG